MKIKLLVDSLLIGDKNYVKGDVLDYEIDGARKASLVASGSAEVTDEAAGELVEELKAKHPVAVTDKATLFVPGSFTETDRGPDELKVTAETPVTAEGKPEKKIK